MHDDTAASKATRDPVIEALYALDEPWRERFLVLTANLATRWRWDGQAPDPSEVAGWLRAQPGLRCLVAELLWVWTGRGVHCSYQCKQRLVDEQQLILEEEER